MDQAKKLNKRFSGDFCEKTEETGRFLFLYQKKIKPFFFHFIKNY